jgi:L-fuculose-phosphate aldolase
MIALSAQEATLRAQVVAAAQGLEADGLNRGASGNVSARLGDAFLITPSAVAAADLIPEIIAKMPVGGRAQDATGPLAPSSEWRFHSDLYAARPELGAVVHTHSPWCTVLAVARQPIRAVHYMIAGFGGPDIRVAGYARFGTAALSAEVVRAMEGRFGCLMANHGMLTAAPTLARAIWLAQELETLAHLQVHAGLIGGAHVLSDTQIQEATAAFATYGLRETPSDDGATR